MDKRIEADAAEQRAWKFQTAIAGIWYWLMLIVCAPITLYLGYRGIVAIFNGIRDWCHYQEPAPNPGAWVGIVVFVVAGLGWMYATYALDDYQQTRRFNEFVRSRRATRKHYEEEAAKPKTRLQKVGGALGLVWLITVGGLFLMTIILESW